MPRQYNMGASANKGFGGKKVSGTFRKPWKELADDDLMPFGKYGPKEGDQRKMQDVPAWYLLFIWDKFEHAKKSSPVHNYIKRSWTALVKECPDYLPVHPPVMPVPANPASRPNQQAKQEEMEFNQDPRPSAEPDFERINMEIQSDVDAYPEEEF